MFSDYNIYDRQRLTLHCVITLQSPLSHIGEVSGNVSNLKTAKIIDLEGHPRSCFVYSGNALRNGILRRRGIAAALETLGLQISPDVHHTLFAGGRIDGSTGNDMGLDAKIRQLMPWLSVLGTAKPVGVFGAKNAQMVHGRIAVGSAYLVCYESAEIIYREFPGLLPSDVLPRLQGYFESRALLTADPFSTPNDDAIAHFEKVKKLNLPYIRKALPTWTEYLTIDQTTRRDSTHDPSLQKFLPIASQALLPGNDGGENAKKSSQMVTSDRLIMAGARLYSRWDLHTTSVETGWVVDTLLKFSDAPYLGGKSNRGNGLVSMDFWYQQGENRGHFLSIATGQNALSAPAGRAHECYRTYLDQYQKFMAEAKESDAIRRLLDG